MTIPNNAKVFIVDDDLGVLNSVAFLLSTVGIPTETCASAQEFLDAYDPLVPGCIILDVRMPGMSGLELQERLHGLGSTLPVIFLTAHGDVPMAVNAMKSGAVDFIQKPFRDQDLLDKIHRAMEENARARAMANTQRSVSARIESLTPREREVMDAVVAGKANKMIALDLGVSERTVEIHRARVMQKMDVESLAQLVQIVMRARGDLNRSGESS
jgi:two-component system response regulator FixJ